MPPRHPHLLPFLLCSSLLLGCGGKVTSAPPPALPVEVEKLATSTIEDYDDYLASLTSRRSITLYAQVAGYVRAIRVKPGQKVKKDAPLVEIDPSHEEATLHSLQANIESRRAALAYAVQNDESSKALRKEGLLSQLDYDQRHSQRLAAETDLKASQAQAQAQAELLRYYHVAAPSDGVVGDVPVKIGDYVTPQTRLTSVDQDDLIEGYLYVPTGKVGGLKPESVIQLLDDDGHVQCEQKPSFVSPQVNVETQTVLVKVLCPNAGVMRAAQVMRGRVVWGRHSGLTIPVNAAVRMSSQYFAYVVERGGGKTVAKQTPITVGAIEGNRYVVEKGLSAGVEIVVSNLQKIRDGAAVSPIAH